MKPSLRIVGALLFATFGASTANAVFSGPAAQMGAIYNSGTIPIGVPAISITNAPYTFLDVTPTLNYNYTTDSTTNPTAGFTPDYHFLGSAGTSPATSPIWTFASKALQFSHYSTIDHPPLPNEALEASLWGSGDGGSTWSLGKVAEVYELGWDANGLPDDGATRWTFSSPVNMISVQVGLTQGVVGSPLSPYSYSDGDFETDAVMQVGAVPEPASIFVWLMIAGLCEFARRKWSGGIPMATRD